MLSTKQTKDAPEKFKGHYSQIKELICHYEWLLAQCQITADKEECKGITTYCSSEVTQLIESLDKYRTPNWDDLKGRLLHLYDAEQDEAQYQLGDLDRLIYKYAKKTLRTLSDQKTYIWKFTVIAQWLKAEHIIQDIDYRTSFWLEIPKVMWSKVETHLLAGNTTKNVTEPFTVKEISTIVEQLLHRNWFDCKRQHSHYKYEDSDTDSESSSSSESESESSESSESEPKTKHKQNKMKKPSKSTQKNPKPQSTSNKPNKPKDDTKGNTKPSADINSLIDEMSRLSLTDPAYTKAYFMLWLSTPNIMEQT